MAAATLPGGSGGGGPPSPSITKSTLSSGPSNAAAVPSSSGTVPSNNASASSSSDPLDERIVANAALESANDRLRSLCAAHAPTFVAVQRRGTALQTALDGLLDTVGEARGRVVDAGDALESDSAGTTTTTTGTGGGDGKKTDGGGSSSSGTGGGGGGSSAASSLQTLAERHRLRRRTLLQHSSLLELLELPALMDACVRSGLYDEALSVAGFANALERRHLLASSHDGAAEERSLDADNDNQQLSSQQQQAQQQGGGGTGHRGNAVVSDVVRSIRDREHDLRRHLLTRLRGDVTMPQCLEIVTALRRLNGVELERRGNDSTHPNKQVDVERIHSSMELRLMVDFFESRDAWLEQASSLSVQPGGAGAGQQLHHQHAGVSGHTGATGVVGKAGGVSADGGAGHQSEALLDGIERYRTRTFEIATQFLAIFRGNAPPSGSSSSADADQSLPLLSMWTTRRVQTFLTALTRHLSAVDDTATLRDALDATAFFATSMGRVGADFQALLPGIFEPRVADIVVGRWTDGVEALRETLRVCRDAGVAAPLFSTASTAEQQGGAGDDAAAAAAAAAAAVPTSDLERAVSSATGPAAGTTPPPPRVLLSLPPLARIVNCHLTGLNELRRCLLPGTFPALRRALEKVLDDVRIILQGNERAVLTPGLRGEAAKLREVAASMKAEFGRTVEPYLRKSLEVAFGNLDFREEVEEEKKEEEETEGETKPEEEDGEETKEEKEGEENDAEDDPEAAATAKRGDEDASLQAVDRGGDEDGEPTSGERSVAAAAPMEGAAETDPEPEAEPDLVTTADTAEAVPGEEAGGVDAGDSALDSAPTKSGEGEGWDDENLDI